MNKKMYKICAFLVLFFGLTYSSYSISVERKIFPDEIKRGQSVIVSITVKKEGEEGFAKLMETIPEDFKAEELNSATGNFICEDGKLRIIWLTMPDGESFRAEYKLLYQGDSLGSFNLGGKFYFVKDGKRSEYSMSNTSFKISKNTVKQDNIVVPEITSKYIEPKEDNTDGFVKSGLESNDIPDVEKIKNKNIEESNNVVTETEILKSKVVFKVQLGVFSTEKDLDIFGNLPEVHFIKVGSLYKYYSGKFISEYEARSNIEAAKINGFSGAFLVKFKDGKKI